MTAVKADPDALGRPAPRARPVVVQAQRDQN
jgi:hypothetical protein